MANLIITIISIALVAVAALMGAYYGGTAFLEGQAKAKANQIIAAAQQIDGAVNLWRANNAGAANLPDAAFNFLVSQGYLSSIPQLVAEDGETGAWAQPLCNGPIAQYDFSDVGPGCSVTAGFTPSRYVVRSTSANGSNNADAICRQIAKIAGGASAVPNNDGLLNPGRKFDCVRYVEANSGWIFVYQLF